MDEDCVLVFGPWFRIEEVPTASLVLVDVGQRVEHLSPNTEMAPHDNALCWIFYSGAQQLLHLAALKDILLMFQFGSSYHYYNFQSPDLDDCCKHLGRHLET